MEKLEKSIKKRYLLFVFSIMIITIAALFIVQSSVSSQILDSNLINVAEKQRALGQRISKLAFRVGFVEKEGSYTSSYAILNQYINQWDSLHRYQQSVNSKKENREVVDSLLIKNKVYLKKIVASSKKTTKKSGLDIFQAELKHIYDVEQPYLENLDLLISQYQKKGETNLRALKVVIYSLAIGVFLLLLGGFLTVVKPAFKKFLINVKEIKKSNKELASSKAKIKSNLIELTKLKTDLELKDANNKIFIEQAPTAIAMLDTNMCYIAASKKWISDYKMEDEEIIGRCHYDLFPEIGDDWKANHQKCLNGAIDKCDEAPFVRSDGSTQWIFWDVRPWYISEGVVGGLIMHTGDITEIKENEEEKDLIKNILNNTSEVARIGTWEVDLAKNKMYWSKIVCEIHGIEEGYLPSIEAGINFYKEGKSRDSLEKAVKEAIENGTPYDLELELITPMGDVVWVRSIGQVKMVNGKSIKLYGLLQDISKIKESEIALNKAHSELKAIFNSESIAIVSTNKDGVISHFNRGAEILTGYSASEMIGLKRPKAYHLQTELDAFRIDMARLHGKDPEGFSAQLELSKNNAFDTREWTYLRKDGTTMPVQLTLTSIKDDNDNLIGFLGVSTDVSEKRIVQNELLRKNQLLTFAEKITKMGNWQWDPVNGLSELSAGFHEVYEFDEVKKSLTFDDYLNYIHPDDKEKVEKHISDTFENKHFENNFVHRIVTAKGNVKTIQLLGKVFTNELGEIVRIVGADQDITEQKRSETELLRKNHFLSLAERIANIGNWQWDVVGNRLKWSANMHGIYGSNEKETDLNYDSFFKFVHPEDKDMVAACVDIAYKEKKFPDNFIHRIITGSGEVKTIQSFGEIILDDQGDIIEMIGTTQDITKQKMAENKFRGLLESAPDAMVITNGEGVIQLINKQAEKLFGYRIDEILGASVEVLIPKRFLDVHESHRDDYFNNPHVRSIGEGKELFAINKAGMEFPIQISLSPLETEQGLLVSTAIRDITQQKLAKNELLRKNQLLNFAEEITLMGHWIWNIVDDKVEWSSNLYNIFELNIKEVDLRFNTYFSFVHPEDKDVVSKYFDDAILGHGFTNFSHRILTNGKVKTVQLLGEVVTNSEGEVIEMIGTCQDITEQKMAENKFRGLLESAPDAMVITNEDSKIQMINKQAEIMFGYKIEELFNKSVDLLLPKRFLTGCESKVNTLLSDLVGTESSGEEDLAAVNREGKEFPVQISLSPLETEDGVLISAAIRDITAQKLAKSELLRKNQLLTFAEKITMMGNWQWNIITNDVKWSSNLFEIFGVDKDADLAFDTYFNCVHDEDKEMVSKHVEKAIDDKKFTNLMHRISLPDGSVKTIQLLAEVVIDGKGEVVEMTGTCQDVTAQRMAENKFRGLLESAPDAMVITNEDSKIQIINKQAELLFGYKIDEIYNKPIDLLLPMRSLEDHDFQRKTFLNKPKTTELAEGKDMFAINKSGREFPIQMSLSPLKTEEGMLISAVIRDVTEQKSAQNKIIKAKNDLEILAQKLIKNNDQLADFAHITSHNLRAPVSNLNSLLGLYNASVNEDDRVFLFQKFEKVINHLTITLNTLVDAVKIKNNVPKEFDTLKFNDVLNKTKEILTGQIIKNDAIITSDFSEISKIKYDRIYLESIFLNLVGNSIKYRSKDRVPEIFIKSEIKDGKIRILFQDNGLGIDLERHGHKLFGLNKVFHRHPEAKGVGLFMVKTQVEALNGTIYATSKVNEGTTFYINFN
ncbi:PAS domain S-box protein [Algibacter sp. Ld11]|uniref:PAS domain S-box protein n=1 Tax=Algibacter sp. Ld11 TaxID=649150 RepID=UPI00386F7DB2